MHKLISMGCKTNIKLYFSCKIFYQIKSMKFLHDQFVIFLKYYRVYNKTKKLNIVSYLDAKRTKIKELINNIAKFGRVNNCTKIIKKKMN